ncbi:tRNA guanosine(34) transglycosylase Tgt [Candidatus Peregrinibacteria bacterium]|nr:tRNA guanosine(34) transglycosylase Tgt [Candidatus Peregrinibacteria bacterium]
MFEFNIIAADLNCSARTGAFQTPHGSFETPAFMPCGTKGSVKTLTPDELKNLGCEIILANTFHLMLRPGGEIVEKMGGLQRWIGWDGPMLTDSGGFQVFSLSKLRKINDEGVTFQSPLDGATHLLTPEKSIAIQEQLGADIIMAFDECPPADAEKSAAKKAMERTHAWALKSLKAKQRKDQALFPIIQGAIYPDLRKESVRYITGLDAPGYAIGGVAVGETKEQMREVMETVCPLLPKEKPRYLMGIGEPDDMLAAIACGVDMFDCVAPTRLARHGSFWNNHGRHDITKKEFSVSDQPIQSDCECYACSRFSTSYLRHLIIEKEILGARLLTIHNLHFLIDLLRQSRKAIEAKTFQTFSKKFLSEFYAKER